MMFIHNNSKHTKAKSFVKTDNPATEDPKTYPRILAISPSEGWTMGGQTIVIIGDNFRHGLQVIFGNFPVQSQLITSHAIRVQTPPMANPGMVEVTLALDTHQYDIATPGMFKFMSPTEPSLDYGFSRLSKLVPRYPGDPSRLSREVVLKRAGDVAEAFYSMPVAGMVETEKNQEEDLLMSWKGKIKDDNETF
jgi:early B-cell factor